MPIAKMAFSGVVVDVTVTLDGDPVRLTRNQSNDKWTGEASVEQGSPRIVDMVIIAPRYTAWGLKVKVGAKTVVDDEGETTTNPYSKTWPAASARMVAHG